MSEDLNPKKLAAIMSIDVAGFSAMTEDDEARAVELVSRQTDAAQDAQQRGLAAAVAALEQQCLAGLHTELQVAEQRAVVAHALEFPGLEKKGFAAIGHVVWSCRYYSVC